MIFAALIFYIVKNAQIRIQLIAREKKLPEPVLSGSGNSCLAAYFTAPFNFSCWFLSVLFLFFHDNRRICRILLHRLDSVHAARQCLIALAHRNDLPVGSL